MGVNHRDVEMLNRAIAGLGDTFMQNRLLEERKNVNESQARYRDGIASYNQDSLAERKRQYDTSRQDSLNAQAERDAAAGKRSIEEYAKWVADSVRDGFIPKEALPEIRKQLPPEAQEKLKGTPLWDTLEFSTPANVKTTKPTGPERLGDREKALLDLQVDRLKELKARQDELIVNGSMNLDDANEADRIQKEIDSIERSLQGGAAPSGGSEYTPEAVSKAARANAIATRIRKEHPDWTVDQIKTATLQEMQ